MNKKAALGTLATFVLVLFALFIIFYAFAPRITKSAKPIFSLFGIGDEENELIKELPNSAERSFESLIQAYKSCKQYMANDCLCDQWDLKSIPEGYSIKLESLSNGKTRMELLGENPTAEKVELIEDDITCLYQYDKSSGKFSLNSIDSVILESKIDSDFVIGKKIQLFKPDGKNICLVSGTYESKEFNEIQQLKSGCSLGQSKASLSALLDLSDLTDDYNPGSTFVQSRSDEASRIIEDLDAILLKNVGKVSRITSSISDKRLRIERRKNMFSDAYKNLDNNKDGKISDDVYLISIRVLYLQSKNSEIKKDYFKIHYLGGSEQSKILAENVKTKVMELNNKLIVDENELSAAEADNSYRFDFDAYTEENTIENVGPVFLACVQNYGDFIACKEKTLIPAVFIDIVEVDTESENHNIFQRHSKAISTKIYEGVKDYLSNLK